MTPDTPHLTPTTPPVARRTSPPAPDTPHLTPTTPPVAHRTPHLAPETPRVASRPSHPAPNTQRAPDDTAVDDDSTEGDIGMDSPPETNTPADNIGPDNSTPPAQVPTSVSPDEMLPPAEEQVTLFLSEALAAESGAQATPILLKRQGSDQEATVFGDGEGVEMLLSQASDGAEQSGVGFFNTSDEAEEQGGNATAVVVQKSDSEEAGMAYAPEAPLDTFLAQAEATADTGGLPFYADDGQAQSAEGSITTLTVQRDGDDQRYRLYTNADQIDSFLSGAETESQEGMIMAFANADLAAGEDVSNPTELLLWLADGDSKHVIYMDEQTLDAFLAQTEALEIGPNVTVFADESEAAAGGPIVNMLLKRQDNNEVVVGYVEETELEGFLRTAVAHTPDREIADLTRTVYQRLRHQMQIERERAR